MRPSRVLLGVAVLSGMLAVTPPALSDPIAFTTIDMSGATETRALGINDAGQIVGSFEDPPGKRHGYVRSAGGVFTTIDMPRPWVDSTWASGINAAGQIVGDFADGGVCSSWWGYLRSASGIFTTLDVYDGSFDASGINTTGQIVGTFGGGGVLYGYVRSAGGAVTRIGVPGPFERTRAHGINDAGQIVGTFWDAQQNDHGYVRSADGTFTTIDVPGAAQTDAFGINTAGQIVGTFVDAEQKEHGYVRSAGRAFTAIDVPGAVRTSANGINTAGQIVGTFVDAEQKEHGYVRSADGAFTTIDVPARPTPTPTGSTPPGKSWAPSWTEAAAMSACQAPTALFTTIDFPGAIRTDAFGIYAARQVVSDFVAGGKTHRDAMRR